jgi:hypothetical protein
VVGVGRLAAAPPNAVATTAAINVVNIIQPAALDL